MNLETLASLLHAVQGNSNLMDRRGRRQDVQYLLGRIALARGDAARALTRFDAALDQDVRPGAALKQAALLGAAGYPRFGLAHLDHYRSVQDDQRQPGLSMRRIHAWVLRHQHYWEHELARLRGTLQEDAVAQQEKSEEPALPDGRSSQSP